MKRLALVVIGIAFMFSPALAQESKPSSLSFFDVARESLFGDVYATPSQWQPLTAGSLFSEGWNRPWASPPPGGGGAPRQGWLNTFDGVFYRLGLLTGSFADNFHDNGNQYAGGLTLYAPFNARFEVRLDIPFIVSNRVGSGDNYHSNFGDLQITPRVLISESKNFTQSFDVTFRIPAPRTTAMILGQPLLFGTSGGIRGRSWSCAGGLASWSRTPTPRPTRERSSRISPPATISPSTGLLPSGIWSGICPPT